MRVAGDVPGAFGDVLRRRLSRLPEVPELTSRPDLAYSETPVEVAYDGLRQDVAALRECLAAVVAALREPYEPEG